MLTIAVLIGVMLMMPEVTQPLSTIIQALNVISLIVVLGSILFAFTDRNLIVCSMFRRWGITKVQLKGYFMLLAVFTIIRLAGYIWDFDKAGSPPYAVYFNTIVSFGMAHMTYRIYKRRKHVAKRRAGK